MKVCTRCYQQEVRRLLEDTPPPGDLLEDFSRAPSVEEVCAYIVRQQAQRNHLPRSRAFKRATEQADAERGNKSRRVYERERRALLKTFVTSIARSRGVWDALINASRRYHTILEDRKRLVKLMNGFDTRLATAAETPRNEAEAEADEVERLDMRWSDYKARMLEGNRSRQDKEVFLQQAVEVDKAIARHGQLYAREARGGGGGAAVGCTLRKIAKAQSIIAVCGVLSASLPKQAFGGDPEKVAEYDDRIGVDEQTGESLTNLYYMCPQ